MTLSAGVKNTSPLTRFACGRQEKSAGVRRQFKLTTPLRQDCGAKFERKGKNDPQLLLLADQHGSLRVNT